MSIFKIIFISIFCCISLNTNGNPHPIAGRVIGLKGKATQLPPHTKEAKIIKVGDLIYEDTSVLTYNKSFVKIKLGDKVIISLGPNSKNVIHFAKKNKTFVGHLMGITRAIVKSLRGHKFLIKTPNTAVGVRGTEFQIHYNNKIQSTTLVTLEGEVAVNKIEKTQPNFDTNVKKPLQIETNFKEINSKLETDSLKIRPGEVALVKQENEAKTVQKAQVSAKQFAHLKKNEHFKEKVTVSDIEIERAKKQLSQLDTKNKEVALSFVSGEVEGQYKSENKGQNYEWELFAGISQIHSKLERRSTRAKGKIVSRESLLSQIDFKKNTNSNFNIRAQFWRFPYLIKSENISANYRIRDSLYGYFVGFEFKNTKKTQISLLGGKEEFIVPQRKNDVATHLSKISPLVFKLILEKNLAEGLKKDKIVEIILKFIEKDQNGNGRNGASIKANFKYIFQKQNDIELGFKGALERFWYKTQNDKIKQNVPSVGFFMKGHF